MDETRTRAGTTPAEVYDEHLADGRLGYQRCTSCRQAVFPPRHHCSSCGAGDLAWEEAAGDGVVYSASVIRPRDEAAYCVALVDLPEGFRVMTNVVGVPADDVRIGQPVRLRVEVRDGGRLAFFEAAR